MEWKPGPAVDPGLSLADHDERDPWAKRFISRADDGVLSLDVGAMSDLETAAGAIFTQLIRHQAEQRPPFTLKSSWSPRIQGRQSIPSRRRRQLPASEEESPMAQYEPFRYTFVNDPTCVPQLRFANVSDTGADHHRRETDRNWRRGGRTWSRLPRFRADKTVFTYDPDYKPPHAVVERWYRTEAGNKLSLVGRVRQSRWQSCHSRQTGRVRRRATPSRVPPQSKSPTPGPASYHLRDPWEVKEVCGAIPPSRVFCRPVLRYRPRTTAFSFAFAPTHGSNRLAHTVGGDATTTYAKHQNTNPCLSNLGAPIATTSGGLAFPTLVRRRTPRRRAATPTVRNEISPSRRRRLSIAVPTSSYAAHKAILSRSVGPLSFPRAERSSFADDISRREESYGKRTVRLLTSRGDVLVTISRKRNSAWGYDVRPFAAGEADDRSSNTGRSRLRRGGGTDNTRNARHYEDRRAAAITLPKNRPVAESRGGSTLTSSGQSCPVRGGGRTSPSHGTPEAEAMKLLPEGLASTLPAYREPGRAELPVIFCAKSASLVKTNGSESTRLRSTMARKKGMLTNLDGVKENRCHARRWPLGGG